MLANVINCMYDPSSEHFYQHYTSGKVLGKGQYGTVRICTLTRGAKWYSNHARKPKPVKNLTVNNLTSSMSETTASKSHIHPIGFSGTLDTLASTTENWPSAIAQENYEAALRGLIASMTPRWRAHMRREYGDRSGSFACKHLDRDRTIAKATYLELYALANLRHNNILRLVEAFKDYDCFYFVTTRCYGDLNAVWVMKGRTPPMGYIHAVAIQLFDALEYIDTFRMVHRDIKPANVFLKTPREFSEICIGDFGMAMPADSDGLKGDIAGSPAFFGKEVWAEGRQAASSDVFAAGLTILALFAGGHPIVLENFLHVCPEVLRSETMAPKNVWKKFEFIAQGDHRTIAKTLKNHCPHDVEKRITLAIVACILSSQEVIHQSIEKAGVVDQPISEFFNSILELISRFAYPDRACGSSDQPASPKMLRRPAHLAASSSSVQGSGGAPMSFGSGEKGWDSPGGTSFVSQTPTKLNRRRQIAPLS
jgi:serine/threonine protein kinase